MAKQASSVTMEVAKILRAGANPLTDADARLTNSASRARDEASTP